MKRALSACARHSALLLCRRTERIDGRIVEHLIIGVNSLVNEHRHLVFAHGFIKLLSLCVECRKNLMRIDELWIEFSGLLAFFNCGIELFPLHQDVCCTEMTDTGNLGNLKTPVVLED